MLRKLKKIVFGNLPKFQSAWYARSRKRFSSDLSFSDAWARCGNRNEMHAYMHHYFYHLLPKTIKLHREYYKQEMRGFGEDAFHSMWYTLLREYHPVRCLEIGVYRGQVISLWALISKNLGHSCKIHGIAPFTPSGDQVSVYLREIDYQEDTLHHHRHFGLPEPTLIKALSTDDTAVAHIRSQEWDLIYIDGNHDYQIALADYQLCKQNLASGGLLVMDDSSLYTDFHPPKFSFAGHPGPSQVVKDLALKELCFLGAVGHNNVFLKP